MWTRNVCADCDGSGLVDVAHPGDPADADCQGECGCDGYAPDARCNWCDDHTELGWDLEQSITDDICLACWHARQVANKERDEGHILPLGQGYCS
jgi:Zn ribbon nucleic-acid-binding protein